MRKKGLNDHDLNVFIEQAQLSYVLQREGGWDAVQVSVEGGDGCKMDAEFFRIGWTC